MLFVSRKCETSETGFLINYLTVIYLLIFGETK